MHHHNYYADVNANGNLRRIVMRLPDYLVDKWKGWWWISEKEGQVPTLQHISDCEETRQGLIRPRLWRHPIWIWWRWPGKRKDSFHPMDHWQKIKVSNMQRWPHSTYLSNPEWLNGSCVGTVAYPLWPTVHRPEVRLVAAKVRVALLRQTTIPRLELMASLVASWLAQIICDKFKSLSLCQLLFGQIPGSFYIGWTPGQSRLSPLWEFVLPPYSLPGTPSTGDLLQQTLTLLTTLAKASL